MRRVVTCSDHVHVPASLEVRGPSDPLSYIRHRSDQIGRWLGQAAGVPQARGKHTHGPPSLKVKQKEGEEVINRSGHGAFPGDCEEPAGAEQVL
jgi:hypothetical protein